MANDKRSIRIPGECVGAVLSEATRAYLYSGNPSAFIGRILEGVNHYCDETDTATDPASKEQRYLMTKMIKALRAAGYDLLKLEDSIYNPEPGKPFDISKV
jgi:hypothetical protein